MTSSVTSTGPDWEQLRSHAISMAARAYVPYSHYPVGAAALVDDGRIIGGCNVENAGYGVTLCAECGLVSELVAGGGGRLLAFVCVNADGDLITPCGRCRQLLWEHGGAALQVWSPAGVVPMTDLLPQAFGPEDLDVVATRHPAQ
ncbi:cytidine deaminase [Propionibacteriaceae bacterium Y1923]